MKSLKEIKAEIVKKYLAKFSKTPDQTLAKKIYKENKKLFDSTEQARSSVRHFRGHKAGKRSMAKEFITPRTYDTNPFKLPPSYYKKREPYVLPVACDNILIISDLHIPYHDIPSITAALNFGKQQKVNTIFINGDLIDFHKLSRFQNDPRKRNVKEEIEAAIEFLTTLRKLFPKASIYFHLGNHDVRYEHWLMAKCAEVFDDEYYHLYDRLGLAGLRVTQIDDKTITKAGKLNIMHGHTIFRSVFGSVSPARTIYLKTKKSAICGHTHKESSYTATDIDGELITCWSSASLCELSPDYFPHGNDYAHGFAHVKINRDKSFSLKNYRIHNGKIL